MANIYESELLYKLMERDGLNIPSSIPPYESEIKAYLIEQVKLAYPKLTDYEAEWLFYNYTKHLPADFPVETITNVTNATVNNVVPYAYKSAILSGNTLVNHYAEENEYKSQNANMTRTGNEYKIYKQPTYIGYPSNRIKLNNIEHGKTYTLIFDYKATMEITGYVGFSVDDGSASWNVRTHTLNMTTSYQKAKLLVQSSTSEYNWLSFTNGLNAWTTDYDNLEVYLKNIIVVEGDHTQEDITYFEGMKSVKMPVLTTTGKNLLNPSLIKINMTLGSDGITESGFNGRAITDFISIKPNTAYAFGGNGSGPYYYVEYDFSKNPIDARKSTPQTFTSTSNTHWVRFFRHSIIDTGLLSSVSEVEYSLEESSSATSYESYKSNILSTSEDVVLRKVGDVQDELNCLTGEIVERIITKTFTGNENITLHGNMTDKMSFRLPFDVGIKNSNNGGKIICNTEKTMVLEELLKDDINAGVCIHNTDVLTTAYIAILKTELETHDVNGAKKWLSQNRPTVAVVLNQSNVKTVDLSITDENGNKIKTFIPIEETMHIQTNGTPIKPVVSMEIPVEAITQNLASFIVGE